MPRESKPFKSSRGDGDAHPWLKEKVYLAKQRHTLDLVKRSVDALCDKKECVSLASIEAKSRELDPERKGVHRNTILTNEEARAYYEDHRTWKTPPRKRPTKAEGDSGPMPIRVKADRDVDLARRRLLKMSKEELVERLLNVEQAYAEREERWLSVNDDLLVWQLRAERAESQLATKNADPAVSADVRADTPPAGFDRPGADSVPAPLSAQRYSPPELNHFDYFNEIEELFVRRRGRHLILSPIDWVTMEAWKAEGIPLHIVLQAVNTVFDRYEARRQQRSIKSILYCREEVEAQYAEWLKSLVGVGADPAGSSSVEGASQAQDGLPFPRDAILDHLAQCRAALARACDKGFNGGTTPESFTLVAAALQTLEEDFSRASHPDSQKLEDSLNHLQLQLDEGLRRHFPAAQVAAHRKEAEAQLLQYRSRVGPATYEQMLSNLLVKRLREAAGLEPLSLFYI